MYQSYLESLKAVNKELNTYKAKLELTDEELRQRQLLNSARSDLVFAIQWIRWGFQPDPTRCIDRRSYEQRTTPVDPTSAWFASRVAQSKVITNSKLTDKELAYLKDLLALLSPREKDVYVMVKGHGYSWEVAAEVMGVSKSTIQTYLQRAQEKLSEAIKGEVQVTMFG